VVEKRDFGPFFHSRGTHGAAITDRDALLAFYDFPAEHWIHLRTTNVLSSTLHAK
jgi:transposase-like protein